MNSIDDLAGESGDFDAPEMHSGGVGGYAPSGSPPWTSSGVSGGSVVDSHLWPEEQILPQPVMNANSVTMPGGGQAPRPQQQQHYIGSGSGLVDQTAIPNDINFVPTGTDGEISPDSSPQSAMIPGTDTRPGSGVHTSGTSSPGGTWRVHGSAGSSRALRDWEEEHERFLEKQRVDEDAKRTTIRRQAAEELKNFHQKRMETNRERKKKLLAEQASKPTTQLNGATASSGHPSQASFWTAVVNLAGTQPTTTTDITRNGQDEATSPPSPSSSKDKAFLHQLLVSLQTRPPPMSAKS